jgi:hypothetical protein
MFYIIFESFEVLIPIQYEVKHLKMCFYLASYHPKVSAILFSDAVTSA